MDERLNRVPESGKPVTLLRRVVQGFLPLSGQGIDVGAGVSPLPEHWEWWRKLDMECEPWDVDRGDATRMEGVPDNHYDYLVSSHILEHLREPAVALRNWVRIVKPGGYVLLSVPHRQLYEKRTVLPSLWNHDHVRFYLPYQDAPPDTVGLYLWLLDQVGPLGCKLVRFATGDWDCTNSHTQLEHGVGEYCIDALLQKVTT